LKLGNGIGGLLVVNAVDFSLVVSQQLQGGLQLGDAFAFATYFENGSLAGSVVGVAIGLRDGFVGGETAYKSGWHPQPATEEQARKHPCSGTTHGWTYDRLVAIGLANLAPPILASIANGAIAFIYGNCKRIKLMI
jgi:hypothetical protein